MRRALAAFTFLAFLVLFALAAEAAPRPGGYALLSTVEINGVTKNTYFDFICLDGINKENFLSELVGKLTMRSECRLNILQSSQTDIVSELACGGPKAEAVGEIAVRLGLDSFATSINLRLLRGSEADQMVRLRAGAVYDGQCR